MEWNHTVEMQQQEIEAIESDKGKTKRRQRAYFKSYLGRMKFELAVSNGGNSRKDLDPAYFGYYLVRNPILGDYLFKEVKRLSMQEAREFSEAVVKCAKSMDRLTKDTREELEAYVASKTH